VYVSALILGLRHNDQRVRAGARRLINAVTEKRDAHAVVKLCEAMGHANQVVRAGVLDVLADVLQSGVYGHDLGVRGERGVYVHGRNQSNHGAEDDMHTNTKARGMEMHQHCTSVHTHRDDSYVSMHTQRDDSYVGDANVSRIDDSYVGDANVSRIDDSYVGDANVSRIDHVDSYVGDANVSRIDHVDASGYGSSDGVHGEGYYASGGDMHSWSVKDRFWKVAEEMEHAFVVLARLMMNSNLGVQVCFLCIYVCMYKCVFVKLCLLGGY
jgi:hypothetical protein